ncbi:MAG TPA: translation elongation factor Ts [Candidatus Saccharimonadales bacterium]|jgi:elongation factor Ts|nr:translation elongation factor Ts [Candidatus Saccharimonadales bacterium]
MTISIKEVKRLRELTGVGMTDAKKALEESKGDFDVALKAMRKKGMTKADKRSEREARAGVIGTYNHDNRIGVLIEVNCETDFVARNEIFTNLVKDLTLHIAASNPEYLSVEDVPVKTRESLKEELVEKAKADGKSGNLIDKIVEGQLDKQLAEKCLLEQPFVKNPEQTVKQFVQEHNARLGENIVIRRFKRMAVGEVG